MTNPPPNTHTHTHTHTHTVVLTEGLKLVWKREGGKRRATIIRSTSTGSIGTERRKALPTGRSTNTSQGTHRKLTENNPAMQNVVTLSKYCL